MSNSAFDRQPTTQDISWIIDLDRIGRLNLDPPYQRRSVWTRKDRQFFLDTVFRGYPSPAIFLHKTLSEDGVPTYHVVDGKQRIETILLFVNDDIRISKEFGDARLDGKRWSDIQNEQSLRSALWDYRITVEMVRVGDDTAVINSVFDRLNRNSRRLTRQELRHARFEGWFISFVEDEVLRPEWARFGVATKAREKRMADSQILSELLFVLLERQVLGFDQDALDELYAKYDDLSPETGDPENLGPFTGVEEFRQSVDSAKQYIASMEEADGVISRYARSTANLYSLWALIALDRAGLPEPIELARKYAEFMAGVESAKEMAGEIGDETDVSIAEHLRAAVTKYYRGSVGANTERPQRLARSDALRSIMLQP